MRWLTLLLCAAVIGCDGGQSMPTVSSHSVVVAEGPFGSVAWQGDLFVVQQVRVGVSGPRSTLWLGTPNGKLEPFSPADDAECVVAYWELPTSLPDGRLGLRRYCLQADGVRQYDLVAADLSTGAEVEDLGTLSMDVHAYSWLPGLEEAWFGAGSLICEGVGQIVGGQTKHLDNVVLEQDGSSFSLGDTLRTLDHPSCDGAPRAGWPDWSPDGATAAFFASSPKGAGVGRLDSPWSLWTYNSSTGETSQLIGNLHHPRPLRWSPDGTRLAFGAEIDGQDATYVYDTNSGSPRLLSGERFSALDWRKDGKALIGTVLGAPGDQPQGKKLVLLSLET